MTTIRTASPTREEDSRDHGKYWCTSGRIRPQFGSDAAARRRLRACRAAAGRSAGWHRGCRSSRPAARRRATRSRPMLVLSSPPMAAARAGMSSGASCLAFARMASSTCCCRFERPKSLCRSLCRERTYCMRVNAVQVLRSGQHRDPLVAVRVAAADVRRVVVVDDRVARDDVDAADRIDHLDQPEQADPDVVVDVDAEVLLDGGDRRAGAAVRVGAVDLSGAARSRGARTGRAGSRAWSPSWSRECTRTRIIDWVRTWSPLNLESSSEPSSSTVNGPCAPRAWALAKAEGENRTLAARATGTCDRSGRWLRAPRARPAGSTRSRPPPPTGRRRARQGRGCGKGSGAARSAGAVARSDTERHGREL